jgi:arylsulfatase A-like enzyme
MCLLDTTGCENAIVADRRQKLWTACAALIIFLPACQPEEQRSKFDIVPVPRATEFPDIVFISVDSLRYDHLGCYGYKKATSPTIDRIASEGVRFENAVSTTSWTLPSHAAMFTGLYDATHGVTDHSHRLRDGFVTLAESLNNAGYLTAGFYGGPYLHPTFGLDQGFDTYTSCMTTVPDDYSDDEVRESALSAMSRSHEDITGPRTREEVGQWLQGIDGKPFFLFLHMWDVHYDYIPPEPYVAMFDPDYGGDLDGRNFLANKSIRPDMPARDLQHLLALYDGEIRFTDDTLGEIFSMLEKGGRFADALIVITADHGEEFLEHDGKGHGYTLFDEVIRVPLIFRWPGHLPDGRVVEDQVRLIDLLPTILALAGVDHEPVIQGRDLSPLLLGDAMMPEPTLMELTRFGGDMTALRSNQHKLISFGNRRFLHFDLEADPLELNPLTQDTRQFTSARSSLLDLIESAQRLGKYLVSDESSEAKLDPAICRRLRALGYIESGADCQTPSVD